MANRHGTAHPPTQPRSTTALDPRQPRVNVGTYKPPLSPLPPPSPLSDSPIVSRPSVCLASRCSAPARTPQTTMCGGGLRPKGLLWSWQEFG
eukprot:3317162-Prymnesium_polylepis.1